MYLIYLITHFASFCFSFFSIFNMTEYRVSLLPCWRIFCWRIFCWRIFCRPYNVCVWENPTCYTKSKHFRRAKEGNVLFNDTLNTFYLRLYGVGHMVKNHSDIERGNTLPPHGLHFPISSKGSFICIIPERIIHTTAFVTPVVEH